MIGRTLTDLEDNFAVTRSLFYCSLNLTASITVGILTLVCSDDINLDYGCMYVSCLSYWSPMDWIDWAFNRANPYQGTFFFTDAKTKRRYEFLTNSSLTGGDRTAQMLARAGQWLLFFFTMFRRALISCGLLSLELFWRSKSPEIGHRKKEGGQKHGMI